MDFQEFKGVAFQELSVMRGQIKIHVTGNMDEIFEKLSVCLGFMARTEELEAMAYSFKQERARLIDALELPLSKKEWSLRVSEERYVHEVVSRFGRMLDNNISGLQSVLKYAKSNLVQNFNP